MSETQKQIEHIDALTKEQTDAWMEVVLNEYDWISREKQKIADALKEVQEKLRPFEDTYRELLENHKKDTEEAIEIKHKIIVLQDKIKQLYEMYKK